MTNQKYVTGQRFKAKIQGVEVEGRIYVVEQDEIYLCQNIVRGVDDSPENFGYKHSWICSPKLGIDVTGLILLPDTEPQKGDLVEVSDDGIRWGNLDRIYTGYRKKDGSYLTDLCGLIGSFEYIRLAKPIPTERELAEKKARDFLKNYDSFTDSYTSSKVGILTETFLKTNNPANPSGDDGGREDEGTMNKKQIIDKIYDVVGGWCVYILENGSGFFEYIIVPIFIFCIGFLSYKLIIIIIS